MKTIRFKKTRHAPKPQKPIRQISLKKAILVSVLTATILSGLSFLASTIYVGNRDSARLEQGQHTISLEGEVFNKIASEVGQSVVSIVTSDSSGQGGAGTGFVINNQGLIITNKHVVQRASSTVQVIDHSNQQYSGKVIGKDTSNDIAFIKVEDLPSSVPPASLADSSQVKVGDKVLAIGNTLGEFQNTVTSGIVSGIGRPIEVSNEDGQSYESLSNLIQTDAAINPGNSGGPLVNLSGEVIGINTAIVQDAQSLGFSIPINDAKGLISQVESTGNLGQKAYLGVRYTNLNNSIARELNLPVMEGALVYDSRNQAVEPGSPADQAGLKQLDVIVKLGNTEVGRSKSLSSALANHKPGDVVEILVIREGKEQVLTATLGATPN